MEKAQKGDHQHVIVPAKDGPGTAIEAYDFGEDAGHGFEGTTAAELLTPFLSIIQGLSPQLDPTSPKYLDAAKQGMILNTVTNELYNGQNGLEIVAVYRRPTFTEWVPREQGGGFQGEREIDDPEVLRLKHEQGNFKKLQTDHGTDLIEQYNLFVMYGAPDIDEVNASEAVLAFTSTKIGAYKQFYTRAKAIAYPDGKGGVIQPPLWAHRWRMTTVSQKNTKGTFFNWKIDLAEGTPHASLLKRTSPLYQRAKAFGEMLAAGKATANYEAGGTEEAEDSIPF